MIQLKQCQPDLQQTQTQRFSSVRTGQNLLLAGLLLGFLTSVFNVLVGNLRPLWIALGVLWLGVGYVLLRQRRYLDSRRR